jgi:hypothetical protein
LGILKISFRKVISYTIQAINIFKGSYFVFGNIFGSGPEPVMTEMGHDPNFFLGFFGYPVVTPNTTQEPEKI